MNRFDAGIRQCLAVFLALSVTRVKSGGVVCVDRECVSRNAKDVMLRSKFSGFRLAPAMPHCTNHFEL